MTVRAFHRIAGLLMLLPLIGWASTGAVFFIKPGYAGAYESLPVKTYPLVAPVSLEPRPGWLDVRYTKTVLGDHLLVRGSDGWHQLDPVNLAPRPVPRESDVRALMNDAFAANPARYGRIVSITGQVATTDTGARVTLDWNHLNLSQRGIDTDWIDRLYKIHYLQWTGIASVDKVLGGVGLALLVLLSVLGAQLLKR